MSGSQLLDLQSAVAIVNTEIQAKKHRNLTCYRQARQETLDKMSKKQPARLRVWVECPKCGSIDKLTREFQLPVGEADTRVEKVGFPCERCAMPAYMYFERTVSSIH
jgi:hypothetical protein